MSHTPRSLSLQALLIRGLCGKMYVRMYVRMYVCTYARKKNNHGMRIDLASIGGTDLVWWPLCLRQSSLSTK